MTWAYLACLLFSLFGMLMLDMRHRLFWFADWRRAAVVHGAGLLGFLLWDGFGIVFDVFARGDSPYMTGIELAPELPLEEVFFLIFLCWLTMNLYTGLVRLLPRLKARDTGSGSSRDTDAGAGTSTGRATSSRHVTGQPEPEGTV